jgi:hypothetical protein
MKPRFRNALSIAPHATCATITSSLPSFRPPLLLHIDIERSASAIKETVSRKDNGTAWYTVPAQSSHFQILPFAFVALVVVVGGVDHMLISATQQLPQRWQRHILYGLDPQSFGSSANFDPPPLGSAAFSRKSVAPEPLSCRAITQSPAVTLMVVSVVSGCILYLHYLPPASTAGCQSHIRRSEMITHQAR